MGSASQAFSAIFRRPGSDLAGLEAIIWDFDGVHYRYDTLPDGEFYRLCDEVNARAACKLIPGLSYEEAVVIAKRSYDLHHDTVTEFFPYGERSGMTIEQIKTGIFEAFHETLLATIRERHPEFLVPQPDMIAALDALPGVKHCIATHSCAERWAKPARAMMNLTRHISNDAIIGFAEFGFRPKSQYPDAVQMALNFLGTSPKRTAFVEDSAKHLKIAKLRFPELITVLVTDGDVDPDCAPYVDIVVRRPAQFVEAAAAAKQAKNVPQIDLNPG